MDSSLRPRMSATVPACRAVVAVRRHLPDRERLRLRALRILHFSGWPLDEPETIAAAAQRADIDSEELEQWLNEAVTDYTCPSYEIERSSDGIRLSVPGFQPLAGLRGDDREPVPGGPTPRRS